MSNPINFNDWKIEKIAANIKSSLDEVVQTTLEQGHCLINAKTDLTPDEFNKLRKLLYLSSVEARQLMLWSGQKTLSEEDKRRLTNMSLRQFERSLGMRKVTSWAR